MSEQTEHITYTRNEWTTVDCFVRMIDYLRDKKIEVVADIGANVGEVSNIFLECFPNIKTIYAYEPRSDNFECLKTRFINEQRIVPIKRGIFYGKNNAPLYINGGCGSSSIVMNKSGRGEIIELVELENEGILRLDLAKLDIEGAEYNVLKYTKFLKSTKYLILEFHHFGMDDEIEFQKYLPPPNGTKSDNIIRAAYIKNYTDDYIKKHLSGYKIIIEDECQYLLERKT